MYFIHTPACCCCHPPYPHTCLLLLLTPLLQRAWGKERAQRHMPEAARRIVEQYDRPQQGGGEGVGAVEERLRLMPSLRKV